jgi:ABC-2 type transport system permease protein
MNLIGFISLYNKEVKRFLKVYNQTLISPIINSLLFLAIFMLAIGKRITTIGDLPFAIFMAPGLITMVMIQNAFANSSSSMTMSKVLGHITDFLIPPLSARTITFAIALAACTRGVIVAVIAYFAIRIFVPLQIDHIFIVILYAFLISYMLGLIGLLCGLYSNSFDQMAMVTGYIITPLSFLSGTFYSINSLPQFWLTVSHFNPFFHMIDGVRYGFTSYHDGNLMLGFCYLLGLNIVLTIISILWIKSGYRIKD